MNNVMVDIEAWGTGYRPVVVSIGAVEFDLEQGLLGRTFEMNIDPRNAQKVGCTIDADTVDWWMQQEDEARAAFRGERHRLARVLNDFADFTRNQLVWGNGENFDNRILRELYDMMELKCPWHYRNDRDMRTFMDMMKQFNVTDIRIGRGGVTHSALDDAKFQAKVMIDAWQQLKERQIV